MYKMNLPSLASEVNAINVEQEVNDIKEEIVKLFAKDTQIEIKDAALTQRIIQCIASLEALSIAYQQEKNLNSDVLSFLAEQTGYGMDEAASAVFEAQKVIAESMNDLSKKKKRILLRNYLIEGYAIINLVRAKFFDEIEYKVMAVGNYGDGDVVLEANPTLVQILEATHFDSQNMSLTIRQTQHTFKRYATQLSSIEGELDEMDTVLGAMKRVQLSKEEQNVWVAFQKIKAELDAVNLAHKIETGKSLGISVNYGNLMESFLQYQIDEKQFDIDLAYALLEKGRNNLAYYLGGDIVDDNVDYQVKTLSTYGTVGRFDVATFSNVINPLRRILNILLNTPSPAVETTLEQFFTPGSGQGDRNFNAEAEKAVKKAIDKVLKEMGFTS